MANLVAMAMIVSDVVPLSQVMKQSKTDVKLHGSSVQHRTRGVLLVFCLKSPSPGDLRLSCVL